MTAVLFTYPLDVIRARLAFQVAGEMYSGIIHAFKVIFTEEGGVRALYRGMVPTMLGMAPYAGLLLSLMCVSIVQSFMKPWWTDNPKGLKECFLFESSLTAWALRCFCPDRSVLLWLWNPQNIPVRVISWYLWQALSPEWWPSGADSAGQAHVWRFGGSIRTDSLVSTVQNLYIVVLVDKWEPVWCTNQAHLM